MHDCTSLDKIIQDEAAIVRNFLEKRGLTKNQISKILGSSDKIFYSKDELCSAIVLHSISPRAYETLRRNSLTITPLPHPSTLRRRIRGFACAPGLQKELFNLLQLKLSAEDDASKQAVIVFDEMAVRESYEYCNRLKRVFGPHKKVQVVLIREKILTNLLKALAGGIRLLFMVYNSVFHLMLF